MNMTNLIIRSLLDDLQTAISETDRKNSQNITGFNCCLGNLKLSHQTMTDHDHEIKNVQCSEKINPLKKNKSYYDSVCCV